MEAKSVLRINSHGLREEQFKFKKETSKKKPTILTKKARKFMMALSTQIKLKKSIKK